MAARRTLIRYAKPTPSKPEYIQLKTNEKRRRDNLITLASNSINKPSLVILTEAFDEDSTGWYGTGTIIDLIIPRGFDFAVELLTFVELLKVNLNIVKQPAELKSTFFSKFNVYRFESRWTNIDPDIIIETFKNAQDAKEPTHWQEEAREIYQNCLQQVRSMRSNISNQRIDSQQGDLLQGMQASALAEDSSNYAFIEAETAETTETTSSENESNGNSESSISTGESNVSKRVARATETDQSIRYREIVAKLFGTGSSMRSNGRQDKRRSNTTSEIPNSIRQ